jgi:hypothetical protein
MSKSGNQLRVFQRLDLATSPLRVQATFALKP